MSGLGRFGATKRPRARPPKLNTPYVVAVRALCEFTAKAGDLDLRFTPSPSALDGQLGHALVAARRRARPSYQSEVSLQGQYKNLLVRGRADGYDAGLGLLEEVKTYRGDLARQPDNHRHLHWAQAKVYAWLMCQQHTLARLQVALVYFDIATQQETVIKEAFEAAELQQHFEAQCERFLSWAMQESTHRQARDARLAAMPFPHADFRPGQRALAEAVYKTAAHGRCLLAQAPTGIGKTVGTLFPLLKACPGQKLDKVFFLTAKSSGRQLALDAATQIAGNGPGAPLRVLELVAREKSCEHPGTACHGDACPLARGFYDRLPAARAHAVARASLDKAAVREVALAHGVCPYYLGQELTRWSDVIVGDYNHYFDLNAGLHGLAAGHSWRVGVLVDEAHNLVERARAMYSAQLDQSDFSPVRKSAPAALKPALDRLNRAWNSLAREQPMPYRVLPGVPEAFLTALTRAVAEIGDHLADEPAGVGSGLLGFYFDALHFSRVAALFDTHSLFDITLDTARSPRAQTRLCVRNVIPAPHLETRLRDAHTVTLFSATLSPQPFYSSTLGLPERTAWIDVPSPFTPDQLDVRLARHISTRFRHRAASVAPIVRLMSGQFAARPGNYLAFFSSFEYLDRVADAFAAQCPQIPMWLQTRGMAETEREQFLARFTPLGQGIGFAVLGGAFAEGIDLPGQRLIGAFIATLGLPQWNPVNEQMKDKLHEHFGAGYDYAYLYPGVQKVIQAAGRVIRSSDDRGVVHLIDDRFGQPKVRQLLPKWWQLDDGRTR